MEGTNKFEFEPVDLIHKNWLDYSSKHDIKNDIEPLYPLLNDPSPITRAPEQIFAALYNATLVVLELTPHLDSEQKTRALYLSYNLCSCDACQKECGTHINKKGQIRLSKKFFQINMQSSPPFGVLELMFTLLHQILHGIFPEMDEELIVKKTEQVWHSGIVELKKEKLKIDN